MMRKAVAACAGVLALGVLGAAVAPGGQDDKVQLRYRFEKGQKFRLAVQFTAVAKMEQIPEVLRGLLGEKPLDIRFEGLLESEVREVGEDGRAALEGKWRTMKAKGSVTMSEFDYEYDSEKPEADKGRKKERPPDEMPMVNIEENLRTLARETLRISVDPSGRVRMRDGGGGGAEGMGDFLEQVLSLNGLMGPFPKDPVGRGDSWKGDDKIMLPGVGAMLGITVRSENRVESQEKVGDRDCALIQSKFTVGGEGERKDDPNNAVPLQLKTTGEGEGKTWFCAREGMVARSRNSLTARFSLGGIPDPNGGGDVEVKGTLKIDQSHELK